MRSECVRILLVDDHKLFRYAIGKLIRSFGFPCKITEAANGMEAIDLLEEESFDLILMDIEMPQMGGIETIKKIRHDGKQTKVIFLTQYEDESLIVYSIQLGASAFLFKACEPPELEKAITTVLAKGHYYDDHVLKAIESNMAHESKLVNLDISPREFQVLKLLREGQSNKEIAESLGLTLSTIESYRKRLIKKTGSRNTVDLISLAYRTGILSSSKF